MKKYINKNLKPQKIQVLVNEALTILNDVGIPLEDKTERALEKIAMCFLAVANVTTDWSSVQSIEDNVHLKTRDIIKIINENFEETISPGSYDDIRRKDLKLLVMSDLILNTGISKGSATNDPTRGYALSNEFKHLILSFKTEQYSQNLKNFNKNRPLLSEILSKKRNLSKIPVSLPNGTKIMLSVGEHNLLQKSIIEEFLPRFGNDCTVLYIGDTLNKILHIDSSKLKSLNFFELSHNELPDVVAYSEKNNWIYLIEAVHSSGPMSETRVYELKKMLHNCSAELIFITCFLDKFHFKKWVADIAWETEVWIASNPDHLIHFNGHKFLGPFN